MTTDTVARSPSPSGAGFTVGGMAKGAGMLAPGLATMLVVLTTDADVDADDARPARCAPPPGSPSTGVDSDGCMSTNDTVLLLASGAAGVAPGPGRVRRGRHARSAPTSPGSCWRDAEGASKDIAIEVVGAASEDDAVEVGRAVARNNLFKCAIYGKDPNWGRVLSAVGTTDGRLRPRPARRRHQRRLGVPQRLRRRRPLPGRHAHRDVTITVDLHAGDAAATVLTNDLTADYVHENSAYSLMSGSRPGDAARRRRCERRSAHRGAALARALPRRPSC